jgi:phosphopantothenoylcysteine decarboxylase/phosphopantothenate--cysteine ligase
MLKGKKIVIGITGSIAAYKIPLLTRLLVREGADVRIIMTPAAREFVTPLTLSTLSKHPVIIDPFDAGTGEWNSHVELGQWANVMILAPVTANTLGKMAHGIADNFFVTAYLSAKCPVFIAPAMDLDMIAHPTTRQNISILAGFGNIIIEPRAGELASGLSGPGRLEEPEEILQIIRNHFAARKPLDKKKVLVTAGPTHEKMDPVRFLGNYSTGTMGFAIAREAAARGAMVTLIAGPVNLDTPDPSIRRIDVVNAADMHAACMKEAPEADIMVMAAAVADYTFNRTYPDKIKKTAAPLKIELTPTTDILKEVGLRKQPGQVLVGFALETTNGLANARKKLIAKNLDFIVLNSLKEKGAGFGPGTNKISIISKNGAVYRGKLLDKTLVAGEILDFIIKNTTALP